MKQKLKKAGYWASVVTLGLVVGISLQLARANWSAPTASAPNGNVGAPINTGNNTQRKEGTLEVDTAFVVGVDTDISAIAPPKNGKESGNAYVNDLYIGSLNKWVSELSGTSTSTSTSTGPVSGQLYGSCTKGGTCSAASPASCVSTPPYCQCPSGYTLTLTGQAKVQDPTRPLCTSCTNTVYYYSCRYN